MTTRRLEDARRLAGSGALLLAAGLGLQLLEWTFASRPIVAVVVGAFLLDLWSRKLGARWSPFSSETSDVTKTWLRGLATGALVALTVALLALVLGQAQASAGQFGAVGFAIAAVRIGAYAFRDELLFRGIPLALSHKRVPGPWPLLFSAVFGIAPTALATPLRIEPFLLGASSGLFFALVWQRGNGGLSAWGAHTGWLLTVEVVLQGTMIDLQWKSGDLPSITTATGLPAYMATLAFAAASLLLFGRRIVVRQ